MAAGASSSVATGKRRLQITLLTPGSLGDVGPYLGPGVALERAVSDARLRRGAMILVVALAGANAIDAAGLERHSVAVYRAKVEAMAQEARTLPDTDGDGEIVLMAQGPFMPRTVGLRSVMSPDEDRDVILRAARR